MSAATVEISETNGTTGSPTTTDGISNINFGSADVPNLVTTSHPLVTSISVPVYSYTKWLRFHVSNIGTSSNIDTLKYWKSSGPYGAHSVIGTSGWLAGDVRYIIANGYGFGTADSGNRAITTPYNGDGSAFFTGSSARWVIVPILVAQPGSANASIAGSYAGQLHGVGYSNYLTMALEIDVGEPTGPLSQKVITFQYNES